MKYQVFSAMEWLYTDSRVSGHGNKEIIVNTAKNSYASCQILLNGMTKDTEIALESDVCGLNSEFYQEIPVNVEKNTNPGSHAIEGEEPTVYLTRLAPFQVYDALKPINQTFTASDETAAVYVCWNIPKNTSAGEKRGTVKITAGGESCNIEVYINVFEATVPDKETLCFTHWYTLEAIAGDHSLKPWGEEHWQMIEKYGKLMRRARQTHFWVHEEMLIINKDENGNYSFDFSRVERLVRMFLKLGFTALEGPLVASHVGFKEADYVVKVNGEEHNALSPEGYVYISQFFTAWYDFLKQNGWLDITIQHVADEPTSTNVHNYRIISGIARKFMPNIPLIEAVLTPDVQGSVDIVVPECCIYTDHAESFEWLKNTGHTLWYYTCCVTEGHFVNRLWDMPLIRSRYLLWGVFTHGMTGFLHWGLNFHYEADPFHHLMHLPPGDTHIVYPGGDIPWTSMRFEAMRAGVEDYELFKILEVKDKKKADSISKSCLPAFDKSNENLNEFFDAHRQLLELVSEIK